jgi:hypothetical protein
MTLQEKLNDFKQKFQQQVPAPVLEIMHNATEELRNSGILQHIPKEGERAADFQLHYPQGKTVHLQELAQKGPVVISFYRGVW